MFCFTVIFCLLTTTCWGSPRVNPRILGGADADIADVPYTASIEWLDSGHLCGAVIVSTEWVLTDAFCAIQPNATEFFVRVGSSIASNTTSVADTGTIHNATEWRNHPLADVLIREFDFALVKVEPPFEFNDNVAAAVLPEFYQETPGGAVGIVTGWGQVGDIFSPVTQLQYANISLYSDADCQSLLGSEYNERTLCARGPNEDVALCWHDEGGPLVADGILYGIALWPEAACSTPLRTQFFGRVASVRDWIHSTTGVPE